jgi:hypothetical protein
MSDTMRCTVDHSENTVFGSCVSRPPWDLVISVFTPHTLTVLHTSDEERLMSMITLYVNG